MTTNTITKTDAARQAAFVINRTVYQPSKQRLISRFAENVRAELKRQHDTIGTGPKERGTTGQLILVRSRQARTKVNYGLPDC